jgi:hypothetical protein
VFEKRVLSRILAPKTEEVTGGCRRQLNEELHKLYASLDISRVIKSRMIWAGHAARMVHTRNTHSILVGKPEGNRPLGRPTRRMEDNIRMDLREIW